MPWVWRLPCYHDRKCINNLEGGEGGKKVSAEQIVFVFRGRRGSLVNSAWHERELFATLCLRDEICLGDSKNLANLSCSHASLLIPSRYNRSVSRVNGGSALLLFFPSGNEEASPPLLVLVFAFPTPTDSNWERGIPQSGRLYTECWLESFHSRTRRKKKKKEKRKIPHLSPRCKKRGERKL